jgi:hypothetical protein
MTWHRGQVVGLIRSLIFVPFRSCRPMRYAVALLPRACWLGSPVGLGWGLRSVWVGVLVGLRGEGERSSPA